MEKSDINKLANSTFTSQFFATNEKQDIDMVITAIKNNRVTLLHSLSPKQNARNPQDKPWLLFAAFYNSPVCALYLIRNGAKITEVDKQGKTIFHVCSYTGHLEVLKIVRNQMKLSKIRILNEKYISLLTVNNYKRTDVKSGKLKFSVSEQRQKSFDKLQNQISNLYKSHISDFTEQTLKYFMGLVKNTQRNCFHLCCLNRYQRCLNVLQYLFQQLSNYNIHIDQQTVQFYREVGDCLNQFDKIDPRLYEDTLSSIQQMILPQRLADIRNDNQKIVHDKIDEIMNSKDLEGHTPLYIASKNGYTAIINLLRKWQSSFNKKSQDKQDLIKVANHNLARSHIMDLCEASKQADFKTMSFLLSCGEEINKKKTIFGTFALLQAVKSFQKQKNLEPIRLLILSGADINEQDTNGWTVLHHACERGHKQILVEIFKIWEDGKMKKILINKLTNKNYHVLHLAAMSNHPEIIQFLLTSPSAKKLELNSAACDGDRCTTLHHAARKGSLQALKKILEHDPSLIYEQDVRSNTALHYAAMSDHASCLKYLLYFDSDYDKLQEIKNTKGKLARDLTVNKKPFENIFTAARKGDVNQVRKMITENVTMKKLTTLEKDRTLLILAVLNRHLLVVKYLIQAGVDQTHKDKSGKAAKDYLLQMQKNAKNKQQSVVVKNMLALMDH